MQPIKSFSADSIVHTKGLSNALSNLSVDLADLPPARKVEEDAKRS